MVAGPGHVRLSFYDASRDPVAACRHPRAHAVVWLVLVLGRWPHPSPWWGEVFWPPILVIGLPLLFVAVVVDGIIDHIRKDHPDED